MTDTVTESRELSAMSIGEILKSLPHRYPFLMIDKIIKIDGDETAIGIKNVTFNEPQFNGHFPGKPVMPGVMLIEGMAQTAGALCVHSKLGTARPKVVYFMTIDDAKAYLREHWPSIREQLLNGTYRPQPVRRVEIAKPDGGVRELGIPTVLDRLIQQAILQVLQGRWDPTFSEHSYGFRPGRSAHQAVAQAQSYVAEGYEFVVDIDLALLHD